MVHPYLRRRRGEEPVDYPHPKLRGILQRTLGVPIFQEQVMRMAIEVGGYTPGEADQLRRDMAAWRRNGRMKQHQQRLYAAMRQSGIDEVYARRIVQQIEGFGSYGFPESHAAAFAHLVYVSAYLKCHYPAAFAVALINAQPMGFYQVATIVADAHRHGVAIRPVDVQHSGWEAQIEDPSLSGAGAIRLGFRSVRGLARVAAEAIVTERTAAGHFRSPAELAQRCGLTRGAMSQLALAGALGSLAERREAVWRAAALGGGDLVANALDEPDVSFSPLTPAQRMALDCRYAESFLEDHPLRLYRPLLQQRGVVRAQELRQLSPGCTVTVAGLVLVRQRPTGPGGVVFMALEDETGLVDVVLRPELFHRERTLIALAEMLLIRGRLQADGAARSVLAHDMENLYRVVEQRVCGIRSRDFH
jgi:error-prone DNA polymerase